MINKKKKNPGYSQRDIAATASNLVIQSLHPLSLGEIPEARLRKLRAYSQGLIAPLEKCIEDEILRPEEAVVVMATGALFLQMKHVLKSDKLPAGKRVMDIYEGAEATVLPEAYLATAEPTDDEILPRIGKSKKRG